MAGFPSFGFPGLPTGLPPIFGAPSNLPPSNPFLPTDTNPLFPTSNNVPSPTLTFPQFSTVSIPTITTPTSLPPVPIIPTTPTLPAPAPPSQPPTVVTFTHFLSPTPSPTATLAAAAQAPTSTSFFDNKPLVTGVFTVTGLLVTALAVAFIIVTIRRRRSARFDREVAEAAEFARQTRVPFDDGDDDKYGRNSGASLTTQSQSHMSPGGGGGGMMQTAPSVYGGQPSVYSNSASVSPPSSDAPYRGAYPGVGAGAAPTAGLMYDRGYAPRDQRMMQHPYGTPVPPPSPYANMNMGAGPVHAQGGPEPDVYAYNPMSGIGAAHMDSHQYPSFRNMSTGPQQQQQQQQPQMGYGNGEYHPISPNRRSTGASASLSSTSMPNAPSNTRYAQQAGQPDMPLMQQNSVSGSATENGIPAQLMPGVRTYPQTQPTMARPGTELAPGEQAPRRPEKPSPPVRSDSVATVRVGDHEDYAGRMELKVVNE